MSYPRLGEPLRLRSLTLRNRVVFAAHLTNYAEDGRPTERHAAYYGARAAGGAGLIITEEHCVHPSDRPYEKLIEGFRPDVVAGYRRVTDAVHAHGAAVFAQLNHNGAQSSGRYTREPVWAPSAVADRAFREVPHEVTVAEIGELVAGYARVAARCVEGGFDGVELQASQSSIIRGFLSPVTNLRTDGYGGALPARARFLLEVLDLVRVAIGSDRVLGVRLGCDDPADPEALAAAVDTARLVATTGLVDVLNTGVGVAATSQHLITPSMRVPAGYALAVSRAFRAASGMPVVGVGRIVDPADAERALADGACDLVAVVRGQLADPSFASAVRGGSAVRTGAASSGPRCLGCNQECVGRVGLNRALGCVVNPRAGREYLPLAPPGRSRRLLVVGGGPGGLAVAAGAAERGHRVTLYERAPRVGGQLAVAATAPGRAALSHLVADLRERCRRAAVAVHTGVEVDAALVADVAPDVVVLATGARPARPDWAGATDRAGGSDKRARSERVVDVVDVLAGRVAPTGRVLVVDELGFQHATSVAEVLAQRGCQVEVVTPALIVGQDLGLTLDRHAFARRAAELGIATRTERAVLAVHPGPADDLRVNVLHHLVGQCDELACDWVVCAVPPEPVDELWHALRGTGAEVHRIGDCLAPRRADAAVREADRVVQTL